MKTVIFLIIVSTTPGSCALVQVDEATHSAIKMESLGECEAQAAVLSEAEGQIAIWIEG